MAFFERKSFEYVDLNMGKKGKIQQTVEIHGVDKLILSNKIQRKREKFLFQISESLYDYINT